MSSGLRGSGKEAAATVVVAKGAQAAHSHTSSGRGRKAILGVGWSALNTGSALVIAAIVFVITSRLLGPEEFGTVALAVSIITVVGCATPGSFGEAIVQRTKIANEHLDTVFWMCVISGVVLYLPILLLADTVAEYSGYPVFGVLLPFIGLKLLIDLIAVVPQAIVVRTMQFKYIAARTAIGNSVGGLVCVAMALNGYGLWALATAPVMTSVVSLVILVRAARWRPGLHGSMSALRDLLHFGLFSSGSRTLSVINLDQLLLGFLAGPAVLGLYFLGKRLFDLLTGVTAGALHQVTTVFFAAIQKEPNQHVRAYSHALRASTLAAFPVFGGLFVLAESAIPLILGPQWEAAMPAIEAFAIIGFLTGLHVPSSALANGLGRADLWFAFELVRHLLSLAVILICVSSGLKAVMIGVVAVNLAVAPFCFVIARKLIGISFRQYADALLVPLLATAAMCAAIVVLPLLLDGPGPWQMVGLQGAAAALVYALAALSASGQQIDELRKVFARKEGNDE